MRDIINCSTDGILKSVEGSRCHPSDPRLHFGEDVFDRVEIRTVGRQEQQPGADCLHSLAGNGSFMGGQIVQNDDVSRRQGWNEHLAGIGGKPFAGHWAVQHHRCCHAGEAQPADERRGFPVPVGHGHPTARAPL